MLGEGETRHIRAATYTKMQVCELIQLTIATFDNKRAKLEAEYNFPRRLPGLKVWSAHQIHEWIKTNGHLANDPAAVHSVDDVTLQLEARYAGAAK